MPALLILLAAAVLRAPAFAIGYVAVLPWVVVNVVFSLTPAARTLSLYYGFPLMVGLAWPLFAPHWMPENGRARLGVPLVAAAALLSTVLLGNAAWPFRAARDAGSLSAAGYRHFSECLRQQWARTPGLYADPSVVAMFPDVVPSDRMLWPQSPPKHDAEGFVFFGGANQPFYQEQALRLGFTHQRIAPPLPVFIMSREPSPLGECTLRP